MDRTANKTALSLGTERNRRINRMWLLALIGLVAIAAVACGSDDKTIAEVAALSGYRTTDSMRLAFERTLDASPRAYRERFASSANA